MGLLISLFHCATCGLDFANNTNGAVTVVSMDQNSVPDTPEHLPLCHHCLSHVTAQQLSVLEEPADLVSAAPSYPRDQFRASSSELLPFKPPRA
ncbi:MAG: ferrichrome ABC transporter substrate-binding protein [Polyangiaceae bacterium]